MWWNFEGVDNFELTPDGQAIDSDMYSAQLDWMYSKLTLKYPALVNLKRGLLLYDNAKRHTSFQTQQKLRELDGIEVLPHPPYSTDIAP